MWGDCVGVGILDATCREQVENSTIPLYMMHSDPHLTHVEQEDPEEEDEEEEEEQEQPFTPSSRAEYARKDLTLKFTNENGDNLFMSKV